MGIMPVGSHESVGSHGDGSAVVVPTTSGRPASGCISGTNPTAHTPSEGRDQAGVPYKVRASPGVDGQKGLRLQLNSR
eukprot:1268521-Pyramimonas_sp.AAC.1